MAQLFLIVKENSKAQKAHGESSQVLAHISDMLKTEPDTTLDTVMQDENLSGAEIVNGNRFAFYFNNSRISPKQHHVLPIVVAVEQLGSYTTE